MINYPLLLGILASAMAIQVMWERFEQINGTNIIDCQLRVRKINRTTAALYGNATIRTYLDDKTQIAVFLEHSPLGNNQFHRYPMKVGPIGWCEFTKTFWPDYYPYMSKYMTNAWKPHECPVQPSEQTFNDLVLDAEMLPPYLPPGLWRAEVIMMSDGITSVVYHLLAKVYSNGHF